MTGAEVKAIRDQLGLTQAEFAIQINKLDPNLRVYPTSVSRWESGRHDPSPHAAAAIRKLIQERTDDPIQR